MHRGRSRHGFRRQTCRPKCFRRPCQCLWGRLLQHEALHVPVESGAIVVAGCGEGEKVECSARHAVAVDLQFDGSVGRLQCYTHAHNEKAHDASTSRVPACFRFLVWPPLFLTLRCGIRSTLRGYVWWPDCSLLVWSSPKDLTHILTPVEKQHLQPVCLGTSCSSRARLRNAAPPRACPSQI